MQRYFMSLSNSTGDYSSAEIDLSNNNLVSFDYAVFQPVLTQMAGIANSTGSVFLANSE
jgi:hypothetical protein